MPFLLNNIMPLFLRLTVNMEVTQEQGLFQFLQSSLLFSKQSKKKDSTLYKIVFIEHNVCISVFNLVFCKFKYFL